MKAPDCITLDFETKPILRRPHYPPDPVGLSSKFPGEARPSYTTDRDEMLKRLRRAWTAREPIVAHHGKFDFDVAETKFHLPRLNWERMHDTEFLLFLYDPHARQLALKPSAERILGTKPEERDRVREWLINQRIVTKKQKDWGAHIWRVPSELVGPYANGDVYRTERLFKKLYPEIVQRGMLEAYDRERRLMPILLEAERVGIRVDLPRLERDFAMYQQAMGTADNWLRKKLHAPNLNLDADADVGEVLAREGIVTDWTWTKGGHGRPPQRSVAKKNLTLDKFHNRRVALVFGYRNRLRTCLSMFMEPWLEMARESNGFIYTDWNQVRQEHASGLVGARTGRLSSSPNFQNISKNFEDKDDGFKFEPWMTAMGLPPLPLMRGYLLPDTDGIWLHRDYNQQELRMLAHFEDGSLMARYNAEPRFDIHSTVQSAIKEIAGIELSRSGTKIVNFSDIYGKGLPNLAASLDVDLATVKEIKAAKDHLMPGVAELARNVKWRGQMGQAIRTWGGREYYAEKPAFSKKYGRVMDFCYKLLNYLIQGSSADVTKEATIRYDAHPRREARFLLTVHDEENASSPSLKGLSVKAKRDCVAGEMEYLREAMESIECDVPMLSDGKTGPNWAALEKFVDQVAKGATA